MFRHSMSRAEHVWRKSTWRTVMTRALLHEHCTVSYKAALRAIIALHCNPFCQLSKIKRGSCLVSNSRTFGFRK
jgi:hypothetical protein